MKTRILLPFLFLLSLVFAQASDGPIRVLFLGHNSKHHPSNEYYPLIAKALGRDAIYFDYTTSVEEALGDAKYLGKFDVLLLYANHGTIKPNQWKNLKSFVENGGGFVPVHCASWCFGNEPEFDQLVGGRFKSHQGAIFSARVTDTKHPAMKDVKAFEAWDETYFHTNHNPKNRKVLMVRDAMKGDPHTKPEPWTWVRTQGKGRIFYTASGHDARVWNHAGFHQLLKSGILWAAGEQAQTRYHAFLESRAPLKYVKRDNIPNYEKRPEPLPYQLPLSAAESMKYTQAPVGFRLELFAAEPQIVNPIYMQWDERGRLWVAESVDYPNEIKEGRKGNDSIKILEDTDGDGKCDKVKIFADGLNIPTSFTFARGGIIVAHAPEFIFFKDTNGDDKADVREVLFKGFGVGDTHAGPSNLRYGFDNWIYGTVGYSRFNGEVNGKRHNFGMGVFRFKPDGSDIEFLHQFNNNTWGVGFNEAGDVFGSTANNNPTFFGGIPATVYGANRAMSAKMIASTPRFYPITPNIRQVDAFNAYTAGCGHAFATSSGFPKSWRDRRAFICGPTGNLLGMYDMRQKDAGYEAINAFSFVASADEWFSPIVAEVGPDGNMWVADWYNFIIQHNPTPNKGRAGYDAKTGRGNAHINPNRDRQHGRIYRVVYEGHDSKAPKLGNSKQLVTALGHDNLFWRQTAQRLLVDGKRTDAVPALKTLTTKGGHGAIHALWTLSGIGALDTKTHTAALISPEPALRRNAIRALGADKVSAQMLYDSATLADKDLQVRLVAFTKLAALPESDANKKTASLLMKLPENAKDEWLRLALQATGAAEMNIVGYKRGPNLLPNASFEEVGGNKLPTNWSERTYSRRNPDLKHAIETRKEFVKSGKNSLRISADTRHDSSLFARVRLKAGRKYVMSGWVRTENLEGTGNGALLGVHELQHAAKTKGVKKTSGWVKVETEFKNEQDREVTVNCLYGGWGQSSGTAWWDDVSLVEIEPIYKEKSKDAIKATAAAGKNIFDTHLVAGCIRCHKVDGKGGIVGPALDGIASRKDVEYIKRALVNPTAELAEGFDKLGASPMPPMNILLNDQELADVMAYLMTLKEKKK